jgi:hypothetical protein
MAFKLGLIMAWSCLSLTVIWLCVIVWAGPTGDWGTAIGFGQLIAALIALPFLALPFLYPKN